jgi:hypothetical protein
MNLKKCLNKRSLRSLGVNPKGSITALFRALGHWDERLLSQTLKTNDRTIKQYYNELYHHTSFFQHLSAQLVTISSESDLQPGLMAKREAAICYAIIRHLKPQAVVETGVANGLSTAFTLLAISDNGFGHLWSIDLPNTDSLTHSPHAYIPNDKEPGWIVPDDLAPFWTLILGDAREKLPLSLSEVDKLGVFIHDSLHTYDHMYWEYSQAWEKMDTGGCLISHDVHLNDAFLDFCNEQGRSPQIFNNLGIVRN